ncbi:MAG TPA: DUF4337 domain-containing protein [Terriglobales bacterium]|nr:DUF4337 domain-containing protein [Terriglobales bacterium]
METHEIEEKIEQARETSDKRIGLTMAIVAVLLAVATMLGHRTHTEEVLIQTKAADQWAYYQSKNTRASMHADFALLLSATTGNDKLAEQFRTRAEEQKSGAEEVKTKAEELEKETGATSRRATQFDTAEIFLEIAIVLSSICLLTGLRVFWGVSFISSLAGVAFLVFGLVMR